MRLALVDDHTLFRKGLISLIDFSLSRPFEIVFEANDGLEMQQKLMKATAPDILIMDINMPNMDGYDSVRWLQAHHPTIKVLVVSMVEKEESIIQMLKLGVKGYLCKDVEPKELAEALLAINNHGYYYTDFITGRLIHSLLHDGNTKPQNNSFSDRETEFLRLACSEYTYQEIADLMYLSPKTIDGYRKTLFEKLGIKNRVGLALYAVRNGIVKP